MIAIAVFVAAGLFLLYVLFVYPLLVGVLSRHRCREVQKQAHRPTVTVLLPVRNGEKWVRQKLESILSLDYPRHLVDIVVISDGSTDATVQIAQSFSEHAVRVLDLEPQGKAVALNTGMQVATGEILFFTDVRQTFHPDALDHLVQCLADPNVGVATGELIIRDGNTLEEANVGLYWRYEKWIRKALSRIDSIHGATGCIYAMRRELAVPIPPGTLLDDVYLPLAAFFRGYRVVMEDRAKAYDLPTSLNTEFRRKVRTQAGVWQIVRHYPALLGPSNRMWFHFLSHKMGRLLLPWALIAMLVSSFFLPAPWSMMALVGQAAIYFTAALDPWVPARFPVKKLSSPIRTFVVLMAAALFAPFALLRSSEDIWKQTQVETAGIPPFRSR
jgi:poly-beta-1,6-N-acetyl-D-glucosamine synthase